jgi:tetratricopeptide (TPR) repeat protein
VVFFISYLTSYESLAALHFQEKHYEESIEYFKTLIRLSPGHADAYMHLGIALQQLGTKYLGYGVATVRESSLNLLLTFGCGDVCSEAIRYLETAVQLLPEDDWAGRMNLGMALADAGKKTKAREVLAEAVRRNPELQSSVDDMIKHDVI